MHKMNKSNVSGNELALILSGKKPIAAFYRAVGEQYDETAGQDFDKHVKSGAISRTKFYISNSGQNFSMIYTTYCRSGEEWRADMYKCLKKIGQNTWNKHLDNMESFILGYTD